MAKKALKKGLFITLEGPEGCGKSTHAGLLRAHLRRAGYACLLTREPGGTKAGELVRHVLLHARGARISNMTETLLFEACRSQLVTEVITPALARGTIVISDRYSDSTVCYQGYGGKVPVRDIRAIDRIATGGLKPDLTVVLDIDVMTGLRRAKRKGIDRMESKALQYHRQVRAGYLACARKEPGRMTVIKVAGTIKETQEAIRNEVIRVIQRHQRSR